MISAREYFLSLVCGLPAPQRNTRLFCMLNAYFDGSTEHGKVLVFAGYMGRADDWGRFTDEWEKILPQNPREPFKMNRAIRTEAGRQQALRHYKLIEASPVAAIGCAIPIDAVKKLVDELNIGNAAWANPYHLAWRVIITASFLAAEKLRSEEPIQFMFDEQSEKKKVRNMWALYIDSAPSWVQKRIVGEPIFAKDDYLNPLQAADLVAWWARRQYLKDSAHMARLFPTDWTNGKEPTTYFVPLPEEGIRALFLKDIEAAKRKGSE